MTQSDDLQSRASFIANSIDERQVTRILADMVRIPSVFDLGRDDGNERDMANYIAALLDGWGIEYRRWDVAPHRPNIVADIRGGDGPIVILEGHMDVVTAGDANFWAREPFGAEIVDGCMYGRGTADMKSGLSAMLCAARGDSRCEYRISRYSSPRGSL